MKKTLVYGVELTSLQEMKFSKWRDNNHIAMNTRTAPERTAIVQNWLAIFEAWEVATGHHTITGQLEPVNYIDKDITISHEGRSNSALIFYYPTDKVEGDQRYYQADNMGRVMLNIMAEKVFQVSFD